MPARAGVSWANSVDDVQFTKDLLAKIEGDYGIDPSRIYATGMSNGGFLSHRLGSCRTLFGRKRSTSCGVTLALNERSLPCNAMSIGTIELVGWERP